MALDTFTFTLHVKLMTGDYITVDYTRESMPPSMWAFEEIKRLIQKADRNLPHYYQTILHINPETNTRYPSGTLFTQGILLLLMASPDVYIKRQESFQNHDPMHKDMTSTRYSIHVYHDKTQRDLFSFLHSPMGFHLFPLPLVYDRQPWSKHVFGKSLKYVATLEEALASLPEMIRDVVLQKWTAKDILSTADPLPYTKQASSRHLYDEDYSDDDYDE